MHWPEVKLAYLEDSLDVDFVGVGKAKESGFR
jgi:hypothetical protein